MCFWSLPHILIPAALRCAIRQLDAGCLLWKFISAKASVIGGGWCEWDIILSAKGMRKLAVSYTPPSGVTSKTKGMLLGISKKSIMLQWVWLIKLGVVEVACHWSNEKIISSVFICPTPTHLDWSHTQGGGSWTIAKVERNLFPFCQQAQ